MIALYKGRSFWPSKCIEFINWSEYSHVAQINSDGRCCEAWTEKDGVRVVDSFRDRHGKGTVVDFFKPIGILPVQEDLIWKFMTSQIGKPYDWKGVFHFITRRPENPSDQSKWFCSELLIAAYNSAAYPLLSRIPPYKVYPGMVAYSPNLVFSHTLIV